MLPNIMHISTHYNQIIISLFHFIFILYNIELKNIKTKKPRLIIIPFGF